MRNPIINVSQKSGQQQYLVRFQKSFLVPLLLIFGTLVLSSCGGGSAASALGNTQPSSVGTGLSNAPSSSVAVSISESNSIAASSNPISSSSSTASSNLSSVPVSDSPVPGNSSSQSMASSSSSQPGISTSSLSPSSAAILSSSKSSMATSSSSKSSTFSSSSSKSSTVTSSSSKSSTATSSSSKSSTVTSSSSKSSTATSSSSKSSAAISSSSSSQSSIAIASSSKSSAAFNTFVAIPSTSPLRWSEPTTWVGGALPGVGAAVTIPVDTVVTLDTDTASLGTLNITGTLQFDQRDVSLTAASIRVTGALLIGTATAPFTHKAIITLTGVRTVLTSTITPGGDASVPTIYTQTNDGIARGINIMGGRLELYGVVPTPTWTKLNEHAAAGTKTFTLNDSVNWQAGSVLAVAPTDYYGVAETERLTLASANNKIITTQESISAFRWGKLQYVTSTGMSLTPEAGFTPPALPAPTVLDERASVGNLTRNIVIQGANDDAWKNFGFGAHLMIMDLKSKVVIDGVEFHRSGQADFTGRYPIHWHLLSYSTTGELLGDATGHVVRNSSVWESANRCIVVHGTNGVTVQNNICEDITGHAFFLEDAVERRNVFDGNLALKMRSPVPTRLLQVHEGDPYQAGPSGFWLTNPDNTIRNNLAADAQGNGFWLSFPHKPLGFSASVPIAPDRTPHGIFEYNTSHSNKKPGIMMGIAPTDTFGNLDLGAKYIPTVGGVVDTWDNRLRILLKRITVFKSDGAYRNRISFPDYLEWVTADNQGTHFAGSGDDGVIARGLFVGNSLNNATKSPSEWETVALATYHSMFSMKDNMLVNFPFVEKKSSGAFKTDDYYTAAVEKGTVRNSNNRLIMSHPGFREIPPDLDGQPLANRNWTYSGAVWDPHGYWGPQNNYQVIDVPFLTIGANCVWSEPIGKNGKSCDGEYYGLQGFQTDFDNSLWAFMSPIKATRLDASGNAIGTWQVGDGTLSSKYGVMRHFAARPGGIYKLEFPGKQLAKEFAMNVTNAWRSSDYFIFAVAYDGTVPVQGYTVRGQDKFSAKTLESGSPNQAYIRKFTAANSLAEVKGSVGDKLWQDTANNLVWIRFQGGIAWPDDSKLTPNTDAELYRNFSVALYPK